MTVETASLTWQATSPLPEPLTSLAAAKNEQYVFAAGGAGSDSVYFASINGDETLGPWVSTTSLPRVRSAHSAEVDSGYLFVVGGYYCCWRGTKSVVSAPISSSGAIGSWSELTPLPNDLYRHATVVYDNNLYVIGGWRDFPAPGSAESKVYKAAIHPDGTLGDWENLAPLPKTLHAHSAVVSNGYIFVIGGKEWLGDTTQDSVYSGRILSDGTIEGWNTVDPLPIPLHYHSATLWDGRIIVTGGRTDNDVPVSTTYIANVEPNGNIGAWEESTALPNPLFKHDSVSSVDSVYVIGGQDGSSDQSSVYFGQDSTYTPEVYGYQFANGGTDAADWDTFRDTFGAQIVDGNPLARLYYARHYRCIFPFATFGCTPVGKPALCEAMTASSGLFYTGWIDPENFLGDQEVDYPVQLPTPIPGPEGFWEADPVVDLLIRYQGYQLGAEISNFQRNYPLNFTETLAAITDSIDAGLANPVTIGIWNPVGGKCPGHVLFPYQYEVNGDSTSVYVYDPNYPKDNACPETGCIVFFDTQADTWSYNFTSGVLWTSTAWQNAQQCNGKTGLMAFPLVLWKQRPTFPWSTSDLQDSTLESEEFYYELTVGDLATLLVEDDVGNRIGYQDGVFYDEIAGAVQVHPIGIIPGVAPDYPEKYRLPTGLDLAVHLQHESSGEVGLLSMAPGRFIAVSGNALTSGAEDLVDIDSDWLGLSFDVGEDTTDSSLAITAGDATLAYTHAVERSDLASGSQVRFSAPADNHLSYQVLGSSSAYDAAMELAGTMTGQFRATNITIADGDTHYLTIDWAAPETALLEIDEDSDGDIDDTIVLKNETNRLYLPLVLR